MKYTRRLAAPAIGEYKSLDNENVFTVRIGENAYELSYSEIHGIFGAVLWGRKKFEDYLDWTNYLSDPPDEEWVSLGSEILEDVRTLTWPELNWDFEDRYRDIAVASDAPPGEQDLQPYLEIRDGLVEFIGKAERLEVQYEWQA